MEKKFFYLLLCSVYLLIGCQSQDGQTVFAENQQVITLQYRPITLGDRQFNLVLPENFNGNRAYKLLLAFHGSGGTAENMQQTTQFERISDQYIVVYPRAKVEEWNEGCNCNKAHRLGVDDLRFVDQIIALITDQFNILPGEIYAAGYSQGALFSQNLLCQRSEVFKAIASVAAPMSKQLYQSCAIKTPTNYLAVHGSVDTVLPYHGKNDRNFGLVSSIKAINHIALLNRINSEGIVLPESTPGLKQLEFKNNDTINKLVTVNGEGHQWQFNKLNTSEYLMAFFEQASEYKLPLHSTLHQINGNLMHVRTMGAEHSGPTVVLISGPNSNFNNDSAWFSLLQPMLAKQARVIAVDRAGVGWGQAQPDLSYQRFSNDLATLLNQLGEQDIILTAFASGNISAQLFYQSNLQSKQFNLKGLVWIDPDAFTDHAINFYQDYPVPWYKEKLPQLLPFLAEGNWNERTAQKLAAEKTHIAELIAPADQSQMDWAFYDAVSGQRLTIAGQQIRAIEIANYFDDLELMRGIETPKTVAVSIVDTDFEQQEINNATENIETLQRWMTEGTDWSKQVCARSGGQYIAINHADHLAVFQHPQLIIDAIMQYWH